MTTTMNVLLLASVAYVLFLFSVAWLAERAAATGKARWARSPLVYTLSLSVYCTAWTFYGAVGYAARSGLEFATIYLGPTLVLTGWWLLLRKLVRIGRTQRITSVADLISSRFGKSNTLGVVVTLLAMLAATPYIALQLQSITQGVAVFAAPETARASATVGLFAMLGLAFFTVLFGTRNLDVNERHHGVVMAIAVEAVVKLGALLAVGGFVLWGVGGGVADLTERLGRVDGGLATPDAGRFAGLILLSAAAFIALPRMYHVMVVEIEEEDHLRTASWAFPTYLLLISLFVVPIAVIGLQHMPQGANPDLFVLTIPLAEGKTGLAILAFIGGFSSATSMVIVSAIALATMLSNHILMPVWLRLWPRPQGAGEVARKLLGARRFGILAVISLGYGYTLIVPSGEALAAFGLMAFVGIAQFVPAMIAGIFWRGATRAGALSGLCLGFAVWLWALFLPSFGPDVILPASWLEEGPAGLAWLRPESLLGSGGGDPLMHGFFWSWALNISALIIVSLVSFPTPLERLQGAQFVNIFDYTLSGSGWQSARGDGQDLLVMATQVLGQEQAESFFAEAARAQGREGDMVQVTPVFVAGLETRLAGAIGGATAHAMIAQIVGGSALSVEDLLAMADESAQRMEYSSQLEVKSAELEELASRLREANAKMQVLAEQKDAFLGQVSHELRTPMTSIRAFAEILREEKATPVEQARYARIIHDESRRLTRLLDDLLDLSVLESGRAGLNISETRLEAVIDRALSASGVSGQIAVHRTRHSEGQRLCTDSDRLVQVFVNLFSNALKYNSNDAPELHIEVTETETDVVIEVWDNGSLLPPDMRDVIFEKFIRASDHAGGAGLGLAICREIMTRLQGDIAYRPRLQGNAFRVRVPIRLETAPQSSCRGETAGPRKDVGNQSLLIHLQADREQG